jgi:hypothetical protein
MTGASLTLMTSRMATKSQAWAGGSRERGYTNDGEDEPFELAPGLFWFQVNLLSFDVLLS